MFQETVNMPMEIASDCDGIAAEYFDAAALAPRQLSALLGLVYQGPMEATPWSRLLECIRQRLDASFVTLVLRNPASGRPGLIVNASAYGPLLPGEPSYSERYYAMCPFVSLAAGQVLTADESYGETAWCEHAFYLQYLKPLDLRYILNANIRTEDGVECAFFVSRAHRSQDYDKADKALIAVLLPHLMRAVDLHSTLDVLASERTLYAGTIDRMRVGTVILDEHGKVMKSNSAADRLFAERDGIFLSHDTLHAHCPLENRKFQKSIRSAINNHSVAATACVEATTLARPTGKAHISVLIRPIPLNYCAEEKERRPAVAIFIRDPTSSPQNSRTLLHKLFRLTPTEIEIALLLVDGLTLEEAADALGVTKNTARAHLRGIFAKTGATRQAVLVKMLLNSVVSMV
jgi:DNA-binding CsgD family transcriptional regulator